MEVIPSLPIPAKWLASGTDDDDDHADDTRKNIHLTMYATVSV